MGFTEENQEEVQLVHYIYYVPRPINQDNYKKLLKAKPIIADVHGGDSKYLDEYGDLIKDNRDPIVELSIHL